jgi:hypothetical protein
LLALGPSPLTARALGGAANARPMLTSIAVTFAGGWVTINPPNHRWQGEIRCSRSFVALLVGVTPDRLSWAKTSVLGAPTRVVVDLHPLSSSGNETQVIFLVGDGFLQDLTVSAASSPDVLRPVLPREVATGILHPAFEIASTPAATLSLLFLAREDIRRGRSGVWRPRTDATAFLPARVLDGLTGARTGSVALSKCNR